MKKSTRTRSATDPHKSSQKLVVKTRLKAGSGDPGGARRGTRRCDPEDCGTNHNETMINPLPRMGTGVVRDDWSPKARIELGRSVE